MNPDLSPLAERWIAAISVEEELSERAALALVPVELADKRDSGSAAGKELQAQPCALSRQELAALECCLVGCLANASTPPTPADCLAVFRLTAQLCQGTPMDQLPFNPGHLLHPDRERMSEALLSHSSAGTDVAAAHSEYADPLPPAGGVSVYAMLGISPDHPATSPSASDCALRGTCRLSAMEATLGELYDRMGGWDLLSAAVHKMYVRLFQDCRTHKFFEGKDHGTLMSHMTCFMASALSGKLVYSQERIFAIHRHQIEEQGLRGEHVEIMVEHLEEVLQGLGAPPHLMRDARACLLPAKSVFAPRFRASMP